MNCPQNTSNVLTVQEDPETGDLFVVFPELFLNELGWKEGDTVVWTKQDGGAWVLSKKEV